MADVIRFIFRLSGVLIASLVLFVSSFLFSSFLPWVVATVGCLVLDIGVRIAYSRNYKNNAKMNPVYEDSRAYYTFVNIGVALGRFGLVYLLGPFMLVGLLAGYATVSIGAGRLIGRGGVMAAGVAGLIMTSLWWGAVWYVVTPLVYLAILLVDIQLFGWRTLNRTGFIEMSFEAPRRRYETLGSKPVYVPSDSTPVQREYDLQPVDYVIQKAAMEPTASYVPVSLVEREEHIPVETVEHEEHIPKWRREADKEPYYSMETGKSKLGDLTESTKKRLPAIAEKGKEVIDSLASRAKRSNKHHTEKESSPAVLNLSKAEPRLKLHFGTPPSATSAAGRSE